MFENLMDRCAEGRILTHCRVKQLHERQGAPRRTPDKLLSIYQVVHPCTKIRAI